MSKVCKRQMVEHGMLSCGSKNAAANNEWGALITYRTDEEKVVVAERRSLYWLPATHDAPSKSTGGLPRASGGLSVG